MAHTSFMIWTILFTSKSIRSSKLISNGIQLKVKLTLHNLRFYDLPWGGATIGFV